MYNSIIVSLPGDTGPVLASEAATTEEEPINPITPDTSEVVWGAISFFLLFFLMRFVLIKPLQDAMANRAKVIQKAKDTAEIERRHATSERKLYAAEVERARRESVNIIEEYRAQADSIRSTKLAAAQTEIAQRKQAAIAEIEQARATAFASLRGEVASLAADAAARVIDRPVDAGKSAHLVEDYLNRAANKN